MTAVFLKVISGILQQHEELLRKYKKKALKLKDYDGIFLKARTTNGRTYFTGHRPGKKPKYIGNEQRTVSTIDGTLVRSRIEAIIYDHLVSAGLLVIYEFPIIIEGRIVYPDFLILHPLTGKLYILEHLGYWYHDAKGAGYRSNFCLKTVELSSIGFVLGKNILTTFEDGSGTIDTEKIDKMIQREFFTSPTVQEKTAGVNPEEFLKLQMQAQAAARLAG